PLIQCTVATQDLAAYPGGKDFLAAYKAKYGTANPDPYAIYGYETMKLGLDTIKGLGAKGNDKAAVLKALFSTTSRNSVLGTCGAAGVLRHQRLDARLPGRPGSRSRRDPS